jgi:hypothetical protein
VTAVCIPERSRPAKQPEVCVCVYVYVCVCMCVCVIVYGKRIDQHLFVGGKHPGSHSSLSTFAGDLIQRSERGENSDLKLSWGKKKSTRTPTRRHKCLLRSISYARVRALRWPARFLYTHECMYMRMYVFMYLCMYVCIYIHVAS